MRGLAVLGALRAGVIVLPPALAPWADALGVKHIAVPDARDLSWRDRLPLVDLTIVDVFPRGVVGELAAHRGTPQWLVTRRVAPSYYLDSAVRAAIESQYELIVWTEEPPAPLVSLRVPAVRIAPVLLDTAALGRAEARAGLGITDERPLILALGSGDPTRQANLRGLLAKIAARADASLRFVTDDLPARGDVVRLFPAAPWLAAADLVVAAGGYHAVHETRRAGVPVVFVPQRRRYDDQAWRVQDEPVARTPAELEAAVRWLLARRGHVEKRESAGARMLAALIERRMQRAVLAKEQITAMA